jgi:hypothetical protein
VFEPSRVYLASMFQKSAQKAPKISLKNKLWSKKYLYADLNSVYKVPKKSTKKSYSPKTFVDQ